MNEKEIMDALVKKALEKETALKELLQLTTVQKHFIQGKDMKQLNQAIEEKQKLIQEINQIDAAFLSAYQALKKKLNVQTLEEIDLKQYASLKDLKMSIQQIMSLLRQIDALDKLNHKNLETEFTMLKEEMKKITLQKQSSKAASSYRQKYVGGEGAFIDNKIKK